MASRQSPCAAVGVETDGRFAARDVSFRLVATLDGLPTRRLILPYPARPAQSNRSAPEVSTGAKANRIICEGHTFDEVLSRPQSRRIVLRDGQPIDTIPPDYRELDELF